MLQNHLARYGGTMPQSAIPSTTLAAAVREYLRLSQEQLAAYLDVSRGQIAHVEAGRRPLRAEAARRLLEIALLLPPPIGDAETGAVQQTGGANTAMLRRRLAQCQWHAGNLRVQLARLAEQTLMHSRRAAVLAAWQTVTELATAPGAVRQERVLTEWASTSALEPADTRAAQVLLELRIRFLEAEVVELGRLLAPCSVDKSQPK